MKHAWLTTEDGQDALLELANTPHVIDVLKAAGDKITSDIIHAILEERVSEAANDRRLIVNKAELDGSKKMLKFLIQLVEEAGSRKT